MIDDATLDGLGLWKVTALEETATLFVLPYFRYRNESLAPKDY